MTEKIFQGTRVADFTWAIAGPMATSYLADLGAEVIKVESMTYFDGMRRFIPFKDNKPNVECSLSFAGYNRNKYGITLNLHNAEGMKVARRLIAQSDVVAENFSAGVMERMGLAYRDVAAIRPDIIMISLSAMGQSGPYRNHPTIGSQLVGLAGLAHMCGWPDRDPAFIYGAYTDFVAPRLAAAALMAALDHRRRTGKGQYLDLSQLECAVQFAGPLVLDYCVNGREGNRMGNRSPDAAPHGAYRCQGPERWCAIAVLSDEDWRNFARATGGPVWAGDPRFATLPGRKENEDELDALVGAWTVSLPAEEVMGRLQAAGVAAGVVKTSEDLFNDPQLRYRGHFWRMKHPVMGEYSTDAHAFRFSKTPARAVSPAPMLGQHNEYVCTGILGMSDDEFVQALAGGAFD